MCCAAVLPHNHTRRQGIIFLVLNYHHIKATLRAADSSALQRISSTGTPTAAAAAAGRQQQLPPESPAAAGRRGLGAAGAAAIKECEVGVLVRGGGRRWLRRGVARHGTRGYAAVYD